MDILKDNSKSISRTITVGYRYTVYYLFTTNNPCMHLLVEQTDSDHTCKVKKYALVGWVRGGRLNTQTRA